MSDIHAAYTQQTKPSQTVPAQGNAAQAKTRVPTSNFFDLLFTKVTSDQATIGVDSDAVAFDMTGQGTTTPLNAEGLKKLQATLDSLLQGLPADQRPAAIKLTSAQLQKILQTANADAQGIENAEQSLIATGLSPDQLAQLGAMLENGENADDDAIQALLIGVLKLVPDEEKTQTIFLPKALLVAKDEKPKDDPQDELASSLNALIVGGTPPAGLEQPLNTSGVAEDNPASTDGLTKKGAGGFNEVLKLLEQIQSKTAGETASLDKSLPAPAPSPSNSTGSFSDIFGSFSADGGLDLPEGLDWSKGNGFGLSNTQASSAAQLTSLVTQAPAASQPHPATQIVLATMVRTAQNGQDKEMTLRLDPPELGKIQIQMHFTKDKSVKTHMIFEKPETMLMMQRDFTLLQQSLYDAGMDAGGNSLSFELGGQDTFNGGKNGNGNQNGNGSSGAGEPQVIETTMSWSIDEATGMSHYNRLV